MSGNIKYDKWINDDNSENYKCRAWVSFNGTGTVAIRASGNVNSITDLGVGQYQVNYTTAMVDAESAVTYGFNNQVSNVGSHIKTSGSSSSFIAIQKFENGSVTDCSYISVVIFR